MKQRERTGKIKEKTKRGSKKEVDEPTSHDQKRGPNQTAGPLPLYV